MKKKYLQQSAALLLIVFGLAGCFKKTTTFAGPRNLTIYGVDNSDVIAPIIAKYKDRQSDAVIKYKKFSTIEELEKLVINEVAEGEGPDIFYIPNGWLPRNNKKIVPLVSESLTPEAFGQVFVGVTSGDFIQTDVNDGVRKIYALPLFVDTLALYYNKTHFEQEIPERGAPADTWAEAVKDAEVLRKDDLNLSLSRGEIAMGGGTITYAPDILYNLFLQAGSNLYDDQYKQISLNAGAVKQFQLFMSFSDPKAKNFSWDPIQSAGKTNPAELEAFLSGKISSMFAYSDLAARLENEIKNVKTRSDAIVSIKDIAIAPSPQMSTDDTKKAVYANYYGLAVSRNSKNAALAWDFVQFATSKDSASSYIKKTKRPTARRDLIETQKKDATLKVFLDQLGMAQSIRFFSKQVTDQTLRDAIRTAQETDNEQAALSKAGTLLQEAFKLEMPQGLFPKPAVKK